MPITFSLAVQFDFRFSIVHCALSLDLLKENVFININFVSVCVCLHFTRTNRLSASKTYQLAYMEKELSSRISLSYWWRMWANSNWCMQIEFYKRTSTHVYTYKIVSTVESNDWYSVRKRTSKRLYYLSILFPFKWPFHGRSRKILCALSVERTE